MWLWSNNCSLKIEKISIFIVESSPVQFFLHQSLACSNITSIFVFKTTTLFFTMTSCRQQWWSWPRDSHLLGWRIHYWVIYWCIWTAWSQVLKGQTVISAQLTNTYVTFTVSQLQFVCSSLSPKCSANPIAVTPIWKWEFRNGEHPIRGL